MADQRVAAVAPQTTARATITTRRDEVKRGEFYTTYVVHDRYGRWRGDYAHWKAALEKAREVDNG